MQDNGASVHDQPVPENAVAVRPVGSVSVTVTVPVVAPVPLLVAVSVYVAPVWPWVNDPAWLFANVRSGTPGTLTVVTSETELLAVLVSPPPETEAVFVTEAGADAETLTVSIIAG